MTSASLPCIPASPALLLIEPTMAGCSERAAQLEKSCYRVTKADNLKDVCLMKGVFSFSVAVLSDMIGFLALRASAQVVRGQWPKARILLLGKATSEFDDHLYDESVPHAPDGIALLAMLDRVTEDPWNQRSKVHEAWRERVNWAAVPRQNWTVHESDPTKMARPASEGVVPRDLPASEQLRRVIR